MTNHGLSNKSIKEELMAKTTKCHWCKCALPEISATVDHVIPISKYGRVGIANCVLACLSCNHSRGIIDNIISGQTKRISKSNKLKIERYLERLQESDPTLTPEILEQLRERIK